ncbi:MAG: hypothetical protein ACE365_04105 [Gammaproteobacteria bacterium]
MGSVFKTFSGIHNPILPDYPERADVQEFVVPVCCDGDHFNDLLGLNPVANLLAYRFLSRHETNLNVSERGFEDEDENGVHALPLEEDMKRRGLNQKMYDFLDTKFARIDSWDWHLGERVYCSVVRGSYLGSDDVRVGFEKCLTSIYIQRNVVGASRAIRLISGSHEDVEETKGSEGSDVDFPNEKESARRKLNTFVEKLSGSPEESGLVATLGYHRNGLFPWFGFGKTASSLEEMREFVADHQSRCSSP